jgi:hypothetical protein
LRVRTCFTRLHEDTAMGNKIVTEEMRRATPQPKMPNGEGRPTKRGQRTSLERGSHTRSKKNPGKRAHQG